MSSEIRRAIFVPLTVGVFAAILVFGALVTAFGSAGGDITRPPPSSVTTLAPPSVPRVIQSAIGKPGEIETVKVAMALGDEVRIKVVPEQATLDAQLGLAIPSDLLVADYFRPGFQGRPDELFKQAFRSLYADTPPPADIVPMAAANDGGPEVGEWLVFIAPTAAEYSIIVRGKGDTTGAYTLTVQTRSTSPASTTARLPGHPTWLAPEEVRKIAISETGFLIDRKFFPDSEFTERGVYKGPDAAAARLAVIPGANP